MAMQSRSRAVVKSSMKSGKHASSDRHSASIDSSSSPHHNDDDGPPSKRRKLSIRSKQTTLDAYAFGQSAPPPPQPPTRVTLAQPHGRLVQKLNGVKTELDTNVDELTQPVSGAATPKSKKLPKPAAQLLPSAPPKQEDKRSLRSHDDGPRLKSELAIYFPNYEDIIFDAPRDPEFITVDSTLYVTDDTTNAKPDAATPTKGVKSSKGSPTHARKTSANGVQSPPSHHRSGSNQFNGSSSLNLEMIARSLPQYPDDPLTDEHFLKSHRRAERKEKQLRNIEKERAMHEKVQLDRLLDGLQGHDWLKVLGITGITDGEAKKFESKRDYFIGEVQALVQKFKEWREQERKQKLEKEEREAIVAAREEGSEEPESEGSVGPPSSDLNASAARQLQQETVSALKSLAESKANKGKSAASSSGPSPSKGPVTFVPPPQEEPITSFYDKKHLRDAALGKARHGRNVTAFGHPIPDLEQCEFELPAEYVSADTIRANARERRRRKRETAANNAPG